METLREPFEEELGREIRETDFKGLAENLAEKERKQRREEDEEGPDKGTIMGVLEMPYHAVFIGNTFFKVLFYELMRLTAVLAYVRQITASITFRSILSVNMSWMYSSFSAQSQGQSSW